MVRFGGHYSEIRRTSPKVQVICPKCGFRGEAWSGWGTFQCPECGNIIFNKTETKEFIPYWKKDALEALHRERKDKFTPPNSVRKIIKDIEDGMAEVNEMIIEFDDSGSKRALMNAIYMFAGLEKTYYDNEPYIEIFAYERYIRIKSGIIVTRNQLNDRMDKVS